MKTKLGRPSGTYSGQNSNTTLGGFMGNARAVRGLSLSDVATKIGVSVQFISNIEHGRAPLPAKYVGKISKVLNVSSSKLATLALAKTKVYQDLAKLV
jgi:transcriptional regulator with XRE-family HTH domain